MVNALFASIKASWEVKLSMKTISMHFRGLILALVKIFKNPIEHLLNILTLAVIITTLGSVLVISKNISIIQKNNMNFPQIVIYLKDNVGQNGISAVEASINKFNSKIIKNYQFISKEQGLSELQKDESLKQIASDVISNNNNPIPDVLIINTSTADNHRLQMLVDKIGKLEMVSDVQMDTNYAGKIDNLVKFIRKISNMLQIIFVAILVIVIYNLIRLQMLLRKDEIIVSRLIGASDSFIMRPLAYYAVLQILIATALAIYAINLFVMYLNNMFTTLTNLFGNNFRLYPLEHMQMLQISGILVIFGVFAVFLAVRWVFRGNYVA
jgi:cell division transport system permease protein